MAFLFALDPTEPQNTGLVSAGAGDIRLVKDALIERIESFFQDVDVDPWVGVAGASFAGALNVGGLLTVSAGGINVTGNSTITGTLGGVTTLTATTLAGTLSTAAQGNITSVGTLTSLAVTGAVTAATFAASGTSATPLVATQTGTGAVGLRILRTAGTLSDWTFNAPTASSALTLVSGAGTALTLTAAGAGTFAAGVAATTGAFSADVTITGAGSDLIIATAGGGIQIKEGTNASMGTGSFPAAATVTVNTTKVTANSRIFYAWNDGDGTVLGLKEDINARAPGTSFDLRASAANSQSFVWWIVEPAP